MNAATATISVRMMDISRFSGCTASNQLRLVRVQSVTTTPVPIARQLARHGVGLVQVLQAQLHAARPSMRNSRAASSTRISASALSYS